MLKKLDEIKYHFLLKKRDRVNQKYNKYAEKHKMYIKEEVELQTEYGREKRWQEKQIKAKAYFAIIIGILVLIISSLISYYCDKISTLSSEEKALWTVTSTALNSVVGIIVGIGISSLVLDFFSYIRYTRERIKEIMLDKKYIMTLSDDEKRNLIRNAEQSLYFRDGEVIDTSLYANIKQHIIPLIENNYYRQYKVHIDAYVDAENGVIKKRIHKIMDIMCINNDTDFKIPFSTYISKTDDVNSDPIYQVQECKYDNRDVTDEVVEKITMDDVNSPENNEQIRYGIDYIFKLKKGLNRIEVRTQTIVPISDNIYAHTITIPCQRYSINYSVHDASYDVQGYGFAFDDEKHKDDIDRIIYTDKYDDCVKVRFENWTLPGDGVVFILNKKSS